MTPFTVAEIELVRASFALVSLAPDEFGTALYQRLFELDRSLRRLFHGDTRQLGRKVTATLGVLVGNLERFDEFHPMMRELGARHAGYAVRPEHYAVFGVALIGTLAVRLGEAFPENVRAAWTRLYNAVTEQMLAGAQAAPAAPAGR